MIKLYVDAREFADRNDSDFDDLTVAGVKRLSFISGALYVLDNIYDDDTRQKLHDYLSEIGIDLSDSNMVWIGGILTKKFYGKM